MNVKRFDIRLIFVTLCLLVITGCSTGAVQFAPTAPPPDVTPIRYQHPGGAFSVLLPRTWTVYAQNTTTLAAAAFSAPADDEPTLVIAAINTGEAIEAADFSAVIEEYQTGARPDLLRYTEQNRQAMGDGSWRITGLRTTAGGGTQQLNTFIDRDGTWVTVVEIVMPDSASAMQILELQQIVNGVTFNTSAPLTAADLSTLAAVSVNSINILNVSAWRNPLGVFFVTGEVANTSGQPVIGLPVRVTFFSADGREVGSAEDVVMGHGIPPGGFAPFSLRFGQGQPSGAVTYRVELATPPALTADSTIFGAEILAWTDASAFNPDGSLVISGTVSNCNVALVSPPSELSLPTPTGDCGAQTVRQPRVTVTVFNAEQRVIAAVFTDITVETLIPGESVPYQVVIADLGGEPLNYIVNVQALP